MLAFRLAGPAKRSFASALNSRSGRKRFAIRAYGDEVIWLLAKYATHAVMTTSYQVIITMKHRDNEAPKAFGLRVDASCDQQDGLLPAQDFKVVFINGLDDTILPHVRVLNGQFPDRSMEDTMSAAQMYWDG